MTWGMMWLAERGRDHMGGEVAGKEALGLNRVVRIETLD